MHPPSDHAHRPIDIDRAAWVLIRRFGDRSEDVALVRARHCQDDGRETAAAEWRCVLIKVLEIRAPKQGLWLN